MSDMTYDITDKDVLWMQEQYRTRFALNIDAETARRELYKLVRQMELVYRPITKVQAEQIKNEDVYGEARPANG